MFTVYLIYINPYFTIGLQYQAIWRALCLGLRIRHVSRGEGESFVPQNPLIIRDRVPSFVRTLPPVLRPACLRLSRSAYLRFLMRPVASVVCPRPACLRFSRPLLPPFRVFLLATQELTSSNSYTYIILTTIPLKTVEHCYSYSYSLLYNCYVIITTTLHIVT